jgi:integrase/recombinase XerD
MKYFIDEDFALSRPPEGPVASYVIPFAQWLVDRGYGLVSTRKQVLMAAGFSEWLRKKGIELSDITWGPSWALFAGSSTAAKAWR